MTGLDIVVLFVVGFGAISGFARGFVQEVLALAAWIFSLLTIRYLHTPMTAFLDPYVSSGSGSAVLAFALLLLIPYAFTKLVASWLGAKSRDSLLGPIDRVIGFGFGAVKGTIIVVFAFSILVLGYDVTWGASGRPGWVTGARTYPFVNAASEWLVEVIAERRKETAAQDAAVGKR